MSLLRLNRSVGLLLSALLFLAFKIYIQTHQKILTPSLNSLEVGWVEDRAFALKILSLGLKPLTIGTHWVSLLQKAEHTPMKESGVSSEFLYFNAIAQLDPYFEKLFPTASHFLSVLRQDKIGSKKMHALWVHYEPRNWSAHFSTSIDAFSLQKDFPTASHHMLKASLLPKAPVWLSSLGIRLLSENTAVEHAFQVSLDFYEKLPATQDKNRFKRRILALWLQIQKNAYETSLKNYKEKKHTFPNNQKEWKNWISKYPPLAERRVSNLAPDTQEEIQEILNRRFTFDYNLKENKIIPVLSAPDQDLLKIQIYGH